MSTQSFSWEKVTVRATTKGAEKLLLDDLEGTIAPGQIMALMGPSGSGKTTLLNVLANRGTPKSFRSEGNIEFDGKPVLPALLREVSSYVEQEDALIGSLTVRETVDFSAKLSGLSSAYRKDRVEELLTAFGLQNQAKLKIGTPLTKGISGGQKRRVSIASQLITQPKLLFLDEPTSGLDSKASYEVISKLRNVARQENMMVIASIHQPSSATLDLFDKVTFLSQGQPIYYGSVGGIYDYFAEIGHPIPEHFNAAEFVLNLINTDFDATAAVAGAGSSVSGLEDDSSSQVLSQLVASWRERASHDGYDTSSSLTAHDPKRLSTASHAASAGGHHNNNNAVADEKAAANATAAGENQAHIIDNAGARQPTHSNVLSQTWTLLQRQWVKARRDMLAYYVRVAMYLGLAILMGTVWLRLSTAQQNIQPFINAIFYSGAFMSFMSVAYIPAYLEDFKAFKRDRLNGLYGPSAFLMSNFLIGLPFLFLITLMFSIIVYFMCHFRPSGTGFGMFVMWLFLDLVAAESMVVFISSVVPIFVVSLALTAFMNGLWMAVDGFLVSSNVLNVFWYYTFYWADYQRYVFQGMMFNEFYYREYECDADCHCMYTSSLEDQCKIAGVGVLEYIGYGKMHVGQWVGILISIIAIFRLMTWGWLLWWRK